MSSPSGILQDIDSRPRMSLPVSYRKISYEYRRSQGDIKYLSVFKKLQRIVMIVGEEGDDEQIAGTCKLHVSAAQEALKESSAKDKEVVIHYSKCDSPRNVNWRRWSTVRTVHIKV